MHAASPADITGELLPPAELVPWDGDWNVGTSITERRPAPVISINLPRARADDDAPLLAYERRRPHRQPSVECDVIVPGMQAGITTLAVVMAVSAACLLWGWSARHILIAFGATVLIAWLWRLRIADSLLWEVESITGRDLNHDGKVGNPARAFTLANPAQARTEARRDVDATEQAAQRAELIGFVHRCYATGTSEGAHGVKASGPDRTAYVRQRDVLMALGIAAWKHEGRPTGRVEDGRLVCTSAGTDCTARAVSLQGLWLPAFMPGCYKTCRIGAYVLRRYVQGPRFGPRTHERGVGQCDQTHTIHSRPSA